MASSMMSSSTVTTVNRAKSVQSGAVAPFVGLKSMAGFLYDVWPPIRKKKFETLSYLPPLTREQLLKEVEYLLRKGWVPCLEFELEKGFVYREHNSSPGYYDGRYWTMWKLPMFGTTDASQVLKELDEVIKAYPSAFVRIIGFNNVRQVQCTSFIAHTPETY
ncbi:hypothetical protein TSUD_167260 [Trifolium subterraneum]|nr:hypothetical protein TSUD_167260 [Trifolium subterraneum]